jgi:hypothetical protein
VVAITLCTAVSAQVLYDGSAGGAPENQPWLTYQALPSGTFYVTTGGATTLDTTGSNTILAGWHNQNAALTSPKNASFPTLDRGAGFDVVIDLRVLEEFHANNDRAGFSLLALADDKRGIELSFWSNEVWAQSGPSHLNPAEPLFTHAEGAAHNTATANRQRYVLSILGNSYTLTADGSPLLTGPVRDYTSWAPPMGAPDVYEVPNMLSFSDNTTSASGAVEFSLVAIPEPGGVGAVLALGAMMLRRRGRE